MDTMTGLLVDADWAPRDNVFFDETELANKAVIRGSNGWKNLRFSIKKDLNIPQYNDTQVLIKVKACGVCGSDISLFESDLEGYISYSSQCSFPVIIGHEFSGEIVAKGSKVKKFQVGDYVTAENNHWCGECIPCRYGDVNQCENMKSMGFDRGHNGAMAEFIAIDEKYCWSINQLKEKYKEKDIFDLGALIEPVSCAYEAMVNASKGLRPGDHVVILGAGGIGLAAIQLAKTCGAAKIIVFEPELRRRDLAKELGADYVLDPYDNNYLSEDTLVELTDGQGVGMAIEASRNPARNFPLVEKAIRAGGEFLCIGMAAQYPRIDYMRFVRRKITFSGAFGHAGHLNFQQVINLIVAGRINILPCITAKFKLDDALKAIKAASSGKEGKVIINP
jgi:threonine dehydrogenase-like Zn-dependent dehydrogenase